MRTMRAFKAHTIRPVVRKTILEDDYVGNDS